MMNCSRGVMTLLALLAVFAVGCGGKQKKPVAIGKPLEVEGLDVLDPAQLLSAHAAMLPADTVVTVSVDMDYFLDELLIDGFGMLPEGWDATQMDAELADFSIKRLGVDVTQAETMLLAVTEGEEIVVILNGDFGELEGTTKFEHESLNVTQSQAGILMVDVGSPRTLVMVFDPDHLAALAEVKAGEMKPLADSPSLERFKKVLSEAGNGILVGGVVLGDGMCSAALREEMRQLDGLSVDAMALSISDRLGVVMQADPKVLRELQPRFEQLITEFQRELEEEFKTVHDKPLTEAVLMVVTYHTFKEIGDALRPVLEGDILSLHVGMPSLDSVAPLSLSALVASIPMSVLDEGAGKADPAIEAKRHLRLMAEGGRWFYENHTHQEEPKASSDQAQEGGEGEAAEPPAPVFYRRFPVSAPVSPAPSCCHEHGGLDENQNNLCDVKWSAWSSQGWSEIFFSLDQEHLFVYELVNNGKRDREAELIIRAKGDRDCDGVQEVLEIKLTVNDEDKVVIGDVKVTANEGE